eukprot:GEMP01061812.1.p1 GENE.GEMP01061812.1~~GEMP01061812.1.p1  ORF type:complete len:183 (+),score=27.25 GEMP01061812.1:39-587(+)
MATATFITGLGLQKDPVLLDEPEPEDSLVEFRPASASHEDMKSLLAPCRHENLDDLWNMIRKTRKKMDNETRRLDGLIENVQNLNSLFGGSTTITRKISKSASAPTLQRAKFSIRGSVDIVPSVFDSRRSIIRSFGESSTRLFKHPKPPPGRLAPEAMQQRAKNPGLRRVYSSVALAPKGLR